MEYVMTDNRLYDDGSPEFMAKMFQQRIRQGQQRPQAQRQYDPRMGVQNIDRRIVGPTPINDPYTKLVVERYTRAPHLGPAHLGGKVVDRETALNYQINADVDGMQTQIQQRMMSMQGNNAMSTEQQMQYVPAQFRGQANSVYQALQQGKSPFPQHSLARLHEVGHGQMMQQQPQAQFMQQGQQMQQQPQSQGCRLVEGHPAFRALQTNGFGSTTILTRAIGQITPQVCSQQFVIKGIVKAFVVPPNVTTVNMATIHPSQLIELVEVMAPPMSGLGTFLVPRNAVMTDNRGIQQSQGNRQVITDGRNNYQQNVQQYPGQQGPRKMLMG